MGVCGPGGEKCCPSNQTSGCNLSGRYKITPGKNRAYAGGDLLIPDPGNWTSVNPNGVTPAAIGDTKEPSGLIPNSTGEYGYDPNLTYPVGLGFGCGARDKLCYRDYDLTHPDVGGSGIYSLDEYYTACGYGQPSGWPRDDFTTQVRHGGAGESDIWNIITDGRPSEPGCQSDYSRGLVCGGGCDAPFGIPRSFNLIEGGECLIHDEKTKRDQLAAANRNAVGGGVLAGVGVVGAATGVVAASIAAPAVIGLGGFAILNYDMDYKEGDRGCHYKYRKDWSDPAHGFPHRFKKDVAKDDTSHIPFGQIDNNGIPKARMKCCTSVKDGVYDKWIRDDGTEVTCPLTEDAMDYYTNNEIEHYGAGVYDPASNVCARYITNQDSVVIDGEDTPDKWCSYNITKDNSIFVQQPATNVSGDLSWNSKYKKYINLLTSPSCISWLELDYSDSVTDPSLTYKPRSKALGNELKDFFIWVSAQLADPSLTPAPMPKVPGGLRSDLIQAEDKTGGIISSTIGCPPGADKATNYIGDYNLTAEEVCQMLYFEDDADGPMSLVRDRERIISLCEAEDAEENAEEKNIVGYLGRYGLSCESIVPIFQPGYCENVVGIDVKKCHEDSQNIKCTDKFYSKVDGTTKTFYPCYQYEKGSDEKWYTKTITGDGSIENTGQISHTGCGYYPEIARDIMDTATHAGTNKSGIIRKYLNGYNAVQLMEQIEQYLADIDGRGGERPQNLTEELTGELTKDQMVEILLESHMFDYIYDNNADRGVVSPNKCIEEGQYINQCCNYINSVVTLSELDSLIEEQRKRSLFDTNFDSYTTLGKFLNLLTTRAAGAFLHHSRYSRETDNTENLFIKNMKDFCARDDIFDWKQIDISDPDDRNKKYNELLAARYSKICNCFWDKGPDDSLSATGNPVKENYKKWNKYRACHDLNKTPDACDTNNPSCSLLTGEEKNECKKEDTDSGGIIQSIISFYNNKDPTGPDGDKLKIDNSCWYHPCRSGLTCNDNYTFHGEYGLTTKYTKSAEALRECSEGSCKYSCIAQNIIKYDTIIIDKGGEIKQSIKACDNLSGRAPEQGKLCGGDGSITEPHSSFTGQEISDVDINTGSYTPSPQPSPPDDSYGWPTNIIIKFTLVFILIIISIIIICLTAMSLYRWLMGRTIEAADYNEFVYNQLLDETPEY